MIEYKTTNLGPIYTHDQDFAIMTSAFAWCSSEPRKTWVFVLVIIFFIIYFLIFFVIIYKASNLSITLPVYLSLSESVNLSINSPVPQTRGPGLVLSLLSRPQKLWFFYLGSNLIVYGRKFEIMSADERVLKYINENEVPPLPKHTQASLRQYFLERGYHVKE